MRRICGIFIFSTLWFILPPYLSFCQSVEKVLLPQAISSDEPTERFDRYDRGLDIDAVSDRFEYRRSAHPVKYVRNQTATSNNDISEKLIIAQATDSTTEPSQSEDPEGDLVDPFEDEEDTADVLPLKTIADPLEPINRAFFHFNDKLYFWFFKPVARGYGYIFPQSVRIGVRNFFDNLGFPIRFVNCVLQGKFEGAGFETQRFLINSLTTLGFKDVATDNLGIKEYDEDFGQTLGFYGLGPGFYIDWPIIGPSSLTDTVGIVGDIYTQPLNYVIEFKYNVGIRAYDIVNSTSLTIGEYEDLKRAALDPYVAIRDAYYQFRQKKIKE
ncbi:MAG: VacJ family lipoprotein [Desulfobacteraceae bacterium]|jgi:phospholipid-binding lipoprotein MlaA